MNEQYLDRMLEHFLEIEKGPACAALAVTRHGELIYKHSVGLANVEKNIPADDNTMYRVYSSGKIVAVTAFMLLLERGIIQLDDPVTEFLPEYKDAVYCVRTGNNIESYRPVKNLTLRHLVTMTSGFTYDGEASTTHRAVKAAMAELDALDNYSTRDFARRMAQVPLAFEPGTHWNYGVGHDVLGAIIEVISGMTLGEFITKNISEPLGMTDTTYHVKDRDWDRLATIYQWIDGERRPNYSWDYSFKEDRLFECAGGGLVSTLPDMIKFGTMLAMGGTVNGVRVMGRKTIDLMRQNQLTGQCLEDFRAAHRNGWEHMSGYGYGLGVKTLLDQAASGQMGTMGEFSWAGAAGTLLSIDPAEETAIIYMQSLRRKNKEDYIHPRIKNAVNGLLL